jgi:hypothetical protein
MDPRFLDLGDDNDYSDQFRFFTYVLRSTVNGHYSACMNQATAEWQHGTKHARIKKK